MSDLSPQSKGKPDVDLRYDPKGSGMDHDEVFASVASGIASSGDLKFKWTGGNTDHTKLSAPPSNLKGD